MDLSTVAPCSNLKSSATLVNSQLVNLLPVGFFLMIILYHFFRRFIVFLHAFTSFGRNKGLQLSTHKVVGRANENENYGRFMSLNAKGWRWVKRLMYGCFVCWFVVVSVVVVVVVVVVFGTPAKTHRLDLLSKKVKMAVKRLQRSTEGWATGYSQSTSLTRSKTIPIFPLLAFNFSTHNKQTPRT